MNPMQIDIELITNAQNKYLCAPKNIGLNLTSCQYFYSLTGTFSWVYLKQFLMLIIFRMISEAFHFPQFNFHEFKHDAR